MIVRKSKEQCPKGKTNIQTKKLHYILQPAFTISVITNVEHNLFKESIVSKHWSQPMNYFLYLWWFIYPYIQFNLNLLGLKKLFQCRLYSPFWRDWVIMRIRLRQSWLYFIVPFETELYADFLSGLARECFVMCSLVG